MPRPFLAYVHVSQSAADAWAAEARPRAARVEVERRVIRFGSEDFEAFAVFVWPKVLYVVPKVLPAGARNEGASSSQQPADAARPTTETPAPFTRAASGAPSIYVAPAAPGPWVWCETCQAERGSDHDHALIDRGREVLRRMDPLPRVVDPLPRHGDPLPRPQRSTKG